MITIQTVKSVHVKLPSVYRYMQSRFIDDFFQNGRLRISSFQRFQDYPDEIRGDKSEAQGSVTGKGGDGFMFHVMTSAGANGYMLAASLEDSDAIRQEFDVDSYFEIFDPLGFSVAVANALPGQQEAFLGFCNYQDKRVIEKSLEEMTIKDFTGDDGNMILMHPKMNERINQLVGNGIDLLFLKEKKYQSQAEFRFVWRIDGAHFDVENFVDVICKEAIQFCRRPASEQSDAGGQATHGA
jgi:hypothetical protein